MVSRIQFNDKDETLQPKNIDGQDFIITENMILQLGNINEIRAYIR